MFWCATKRNSIAIQFNSIQYEMYCHDLEVMSLIPCQVEFEVHNTSVKNRPLTISTQTIIVEQLLYCN